MTFIADDDAIQRLVEQAASRAQDHMVAAVDAVAADHSGRPLDEVLDALAAKFAAGGVTMNRDSTPIQTVARYISEGRDITLVKGDLIT